MQIVVVGQMCTHNSVLDPFEAVAGWSLPANVADHYLTLAVGDPWLLNVSLHDDFLRAVQNLRLLLRSITFPAYCQSHVGENCLDLEQLHNDVIVLRIPFF